MPESPAVPIAIVTGAAGGLGSAVAMRLAASGAKVVCVDLDESRIAEATGNSRHCTALAANLREWKSCEEVVSWTVARFGRVDILVNAAGILRRVSPEDVDAEMFSTVMDTNARSAFILMSRAMADMESRRWGRIVNVVSVGVHTGGYSLTSAVYEASKAAVGNFTRTFARYGAPRGILVNSVAPGGIRTRMLLADTPPELLKTVVADIPLGRIAEPAEVAALVAFLASGENTYCSGATMDINGGTVMP